MYLLPLKDAFSLEIIVQMIREGADSAVKKFARVQADAEAGFIVELRQLYGGKTLYCYDQSHKNDFATRPPRTWNAVASSFDECISKFRPHVFHCHGEVQWTAIEQQLKVYRSAGQVPSLQPEQVIVFKAGVFWYRFFCIKGDEFCDKVAEGLAVARQREARAIRLTRR